MSKFSVMSDTDAKLEILKKEVISGMLSER
jgi:hypothetical protein